MQIWAESGKSALPICNYSQILYQFLTFTQNLKRSPKILCRIDENFSYCDEIGIIQYRFVSSSFMQYKVGL